MYSSIMSMIEFTIDFCMCCQLKSIEMIDLVKYPVSRGNCLVQSSLYDCSTTLQKPNNPHWCLKCNIPVAKEIQQGQKATATLVRASCVLTEIYCPASQTVSPLRMRRRYSGNLLTFSGLPKNPSNPALRILSCSLI